MSAMDTLPPERPGRPAAPDLAQRREQMGEAVRGGLFRTERPPVETEIAGRRTLRFPPQGIGPRGWMLQLHGGGYRIGRPEFEGPLSEALAARCGVEVVVPQYRLSPEGPFPAGLVDALAVIEALRAEIGEEAKLIVGGDSAGGGLAAALALHCLARGGPRIDGLVLLSPWLDLTITAPAYAENAADPMFSREQADIASELYLQGFDPTHPLASPLFADLAGLPPVLVSVGTGEVLRDDALRFHEKLQASGVPSRLSAIEGMDHVAVVRGMDLPGSAETFEEIAGFVEALLGA